jgi:hypothetical protein
MTSLNTLLSLIREWSSLPTIQCQTINIGGGTQLVVYLGGKFHLLIPGMDISPFFSHLDQAILHSALTTSIQWLGADYAISSSSYKQDEQLRKVFVKVTLNQRTVIAEAEVPYIALLQAYLDLVFLLNNEDPAALNVLADFAKTVPSVPLG